MVGQYQTRRSANSRSAHVDRLRVASLDRLHTPHFLDAFHTVLLGFTAINLLCACMRSSGLQCNFLRHICRPSLALSALRPMEVVPAWCSPFQGNIDKMERHPEPSELRELLTRSILAAKEFSRSGRQGSDPSGPPKLHCRLPVGLACAHAVAYNSSG